MRFCAYILLTSLVCVCCFAQQEEEPNLYNRLVNPKKDKVSSVVRGFQEKKFEGSTTVDLRKKPGMNMTFAYDKKNAEAGTYKGVRSLFGIKNPWLGKKVYSTKDASLFSKSLVQNADKPYPVEAEKVRAFYQEDKKAPIKDALDPKPFTGQGTRKGALAKVSDMMEKDMTVEQVREILNKNR